MSNEIRCIIGCVQRDHVDEVLEQWRRERPDLDPSPMGIVGRISRASRYLESGLATVFGRHGISEGEFDVLATLRRAGSPFRLSHGELARACMLSASAMTSRLDRLEAAGLLRRERDPEDRRGVKIVLTDDGRKLVDTVVGQHIENEMTLLAPLSRSDGKAIADALRRLLLAFERSEGPPASPG
jgi:DNA-binding MarR family transcriptional regulator